MGDQGRDHLSYVRGMVHLRDLGECLPYPLFPSNPDPAPPRPLTSACHLYYGDSELVEEKKMLIVIMCLLINTCLCALLCVRNVERPVKHIYLLSPYCQAL